jgi:hypothetical protein
MSTIAGDSKPDLKYKKTGKQLQVPKRVLFEHALAHLNKYRFLTESQKKVVPNPYTDKLVARLQDGRSVEIPVDIQQEAIKFWGMSSMSRTRGSSNSNDPNKLCMDLPGSYPGESTNDDSETETTSTRETKQKGSSRRNKVTESADYEESVDSPSTEGFSKRQTPMSKIQNGKRKNISQESETKSTSSSKKNKPVKSESNTLKKGGKKSTSPSKKNKPVKSGSNTLKKGGKKSTSPSKKNKPVKSGSNILKKGGKKSTSPSKKNKPVKSGSNSLKKGGKKSTSPNKKNKPVKSRSNTLKKGGKKSKTPSNRMNSIQSKRQNSKRGPMAQQPDTDGDIPGVVRHYHIYGDDARGGFIDACGKLCSGFDMHKSPAKRRPPKMGEKRVKKSEDKKSTVKKPANKQEGNKQTSKKLAASKRATKKPVVKKQTTINKQENRMEGFGSLTFEGMDGDLDDDQQLDQDNDYQDDNGYDDSSVDPDDVEYDDDNGDDIDTFASVEGMSDGMDNEDDGDEEDDEEEEDDDGDNDDDDEEPFGNLRFVGIEGMNDDGSEDDEVDDDENEDDEDDEDDGDDEDFRNIKFLGIEGMTDGEDEDEDDGDEDDDDDEDDDEDDEDDDENDEPFGNLSEIGEELLIGTRNIGMYMGNLSGSLFSDKNVNDDYIWNGRIIS